MYEQKKGVSNNSWLKKFLKKGENGSMNGSMNDLFNALSSNNIFECGTEYIDRVREKFFNVDKKVLSAEHSPIYSIESIVEGVNTLMYQNKRFEVFFKESNSDKLVVTFDGSRTSNGGQMIPIPSFPRWSWFPFIDANYLCMEDPMYYEFAELKIGWFYGTATEDYRKYVVDIINQLAVKLKVSEIILYGSSGGGSVAIAIGSQIPNSRVVAINPQVMLHQFPQAKNFERITGVDLQHDDLGRNNTCAMLTGAPKTKFLILYNLQSHDDMENQCKPLVDKLGMDVKYGLNKRNNVDIWIYDAKSNNPHTALESYIEYCFIRDIYTYDVDKQKNMVFWINEIWKSRYDSLARSEKYALNVFERKNIVRKEYSSFVLKSEGRYSHRCIALLSKGIFHVHLLYNVLQGDSETCVTLMVKSQNNEKNTSRIDIKSGNMVNVFCNEDKSELLIYGGIIGETDGNIIDFMSISVYK